MAEAQAAAKPALDHRVFLVVVDETEEMSVALRFAALRARSTGGKVAMLYVVEPSEFQHWMAVGDIMRDWIDFGIGVYTRITADSPEFFQRHITPRRAIQ